MNISPKEKLENLLYNETEMTRGDASDAAEAVEKMIEERPDNQ